MRKLLLPLFIISAMTILAVSCKKGDTGPAGPAGPAGQAGAQGPKGDSGTANVIYSNWLDLTFVPITSQAGDTVAWIDSIIAPKITSDILNNGVIKVYLNAGTPTDQAVFPLPITDLYALTGVQNINVYFTVGKINLYATDDPSTFTVGGEQAFQYRYVIIPGSVNGRTANKINWNNYAEVKAYLGLKD